VAQLGDDVALHGLDRLGHAGEVRGQLPRQMQHVLGRLEQLFVVDGAALFEPVSSFCRCRISSSRRAIRAITSGSASCASRSVASSSVLTRDSDALVLAPPTRPATSSAPTTVRGQPVHLDVLVGHLPHQPARLPAQVARVPGGQRLVVLVAVARRPQLVEASLISACASATATLGRSGVNTIASTVTTSGAYVR
jgi:hypothetical protein